MSRRLPLILILIAGAAAAAPVVTVTPAEKGLAWSVGEQVCGSSDHWLQVRDLAVGESFTPVPVTMAEGRFTGALSGLRFGGDWTPCPGGAVLHCSVAAEPAVDRALIVRVSLPLPAEGCTWWEDALDSRTIERGQTYTRVADWYGLRKVSIYPLCAVSAPDTGICLATPLDEPRVFRLAYSGERQALEGEFDLGLSPDAVKLGPKADFHLYVYGVTPAGGFREGLQHYYELFPEYAKRRVDAAGIWLLGFRPETMACPWDWGFKFDEGAERHALYDREHDILSFVYTEPAGKYENFGQVPSRSGKPEYGEQAPPLSPEELKQSVLKDLHASDEQRDRHFNAPRRVIAVADANSAIENHDGSWVWRHWTNEWSSDGSWISNLTLNPDPDLPRPNRASVTWGVELERAFETARAQGAALSGVYLDSVCGFTGFYNENFRREHWRYADVPLTISYRYKQPVQLHSFCFWELSAPMAETLWKQGQYLIANTGRPEMMHFTPRLDMISASEGNRCGLAADEHYRYLRALSAGKVISWMDYSFVKSDVPWAEKERGMQRCLFYGVHPGTGSFENPAQYEPSRPLYRRYEPLITWVDQAGWQPVTLARATEPAVLVERYGPGSGELAGVSFITVRNAGKEPLAPAVRVPQEALPAACRGQKTPNCLAWLLVADRPAPVQWISSRLGDQHATGGAAGRESLLNVMQVPVPADGTEVVALGTREALAKLWLQQAAQWLGRTEREAAWLARGGSALPADGSFEGGLGAWGTDGQNGRKATVALETAAPLAGKASLRAVSEGDDAFQSLHQGLTLLPGETYTLRFTYSWSRPEGAAGVVYPRFGVKGPDGNWAGSKYLVFRELQPTGGKPATFEKQFTIPEGHSVGFFQFMFEGNWGTVVLDEVSITSPRQQSGHQHLADLQQAAAEGAVRLGAAVAQKPLRDLPALVTAQRPLYGRLRALARDLPDPHVRRCLTLPVEDFAESLGHVTQVASGYTLDLAQGGRVADAAIADGAALQLRLSGGKRTAARYEAEGATELPAARPGADPEGLRVATPGESGYGWTDVPLSATFTLEGRSIWLPARVTLRLHAPLTVEATEPLSTVSGGVSLSVASWLSAGRSLSLRGTLHAAGYTGETEPVSVIPVPGAVEHVLLRLPPDAGAALDALAVRRETAKLGWAADGAKGITEVPVVRGVICPAIAAPEVDGRLTPGEWHGAAAAEGFVTPADGKPAGHATRVLVGHDAAALYVAFRCEGPPPTAATRARDGAIWEDDAVELFLRPPGSEAYYHLAVNAAGSVLDGRCDPGENLSWNGSWRAAAAKSDGGYVVEIAVPFSAIGAAPAAALWRLNFGREEGARSPASCWNPTGSGFHVPAWFGEMRVEE